MKYIYNPSTDPYFNLAAEEYLLKSFPDDVFMLWVNRDVIVVGNNQNTMAEINVGYVREQDIAVVRRLTGGGAVFHDRGNLNYTFITASGNRELDFAYFGNIIIGALRTLGLNAELSGRNDLVIVGADGAGRKFSGTAQTVQGGRVLHHGTLMLNIVLDKLSGALKVSPEKIAGKGVKSVRSRVTNINEHLTEPIAIDGLVTAIAAYIASQYPGIEPYELTEADQAAIGKLADAKYRTWEWNYGRSPSYNFEKDVKFATGNLQARLQVKSGRIESAAFFGDFFGTRPASELAEKLAGVRHDRVAVAAVLADEPVGDYFYGATANDIADALV